MIVSQTTNAASVPEALTVRSRTPPAMVASPPVGAYAVSCTGRRPPAGAFQTLFCPSRLETKTTEPSGIGKPSPLFDGSSVIRSNEPSSRFSRQRSMLPGPRYAGRVKSYRPRVKTTEDPSWLICGTYPNASVKRTIGPSPSAVALNIRYERYAEASCRAEIITCSPSVVKPPRYRERSDAVMRRTGPATIPSGV
jgi:hypothetical protein